MHINNILWINVVKLFCIYKQLYFPLFHGNRFCFKIEGGICFNAIFFFNNTIGNFIEYLNTLNIFFLNILNNFVQIF